MGAIAAIAAAIVVFALVSLLRGSSDPSGSNVLRSRDGGTGGATTSRPNLPRPAGGGDPMLSGRILDSAGVPIAGVTITVGAELAAPDPKSDDPSGGLVVGGGVVTTVTDDNGGFALANLPPGLHRIGIEGPDVVAAEVRFVTLPALSLDITALRQVTLSGIVSGESRGDIAVIARGELGEERVIAGTDGTFVLSSLPEGVYRVWAEGEGVGSVAITVEARGATEFDALELTLVAAISARGRLLDRETAAAIEGDVVFTSETGEPDRKATSDASGNYVVHALLPGRWSAQALAAGYVPSEQVAFEADRERQLDLLLSRGGALEGRALDPDGNPVIGAVLEAAAENQETRDRKPVIAAMPATAPGTRFVPRGELGVLLGPIPFPPASPLTGGRVAQPLSASEPTSDATTGRLSDDSGRFRIGGLRAGTYRVIASHPDYAGGFVAGVDVALGKTRRDVTIVLRRGVRIGGAVLDEGRSPIVGAVVTAIIAGNPPVRAVTGDDGRFELPPLIGSITLEASASGYASARRVAPVAKDGATQAIDFGLERADKALVGRVSDSAGLPVRSAHVTIADSGAGDTTDDAGRFEIRGVASGAHELKITHAKFPTLLTKVEASDSLSITLPIGGGLSGELRESRTGSPVAGATLEMRRGKEAVTAKSSEAGEFTISPLAAGDWKLTVVAAGFARLERSIAIPAGPTPGEITVRGRRIEIARGVVVGGTIKDENGERVVGAAIQVGDLKTTSDIDGRFRLVDVPAGTVLIEVKSDNRTGSEEIELSPGDERPTLDIRVTPAD